RILQVVSGGDYGWRSGTGKWPAYYEDSLPSVIDIGPGSPTGMLSGADLKFPAAWKEAIFALDWTFGLIYAIHLDPVGAGYTGRKEVFASGAPLPLTDAVAGADGALYVVTGGRGTTSAIYRIAYEGDESTACQPSGADPDDPASIARAQRRELEAFHGRENPAALDAAWPWLSSPDRFLRHAARIAIESQPVAQWADRVFAEPDPQARITGAVALARAGQPEHRAALLEALLELDPASLSDHQFLGLCRAYALAFIRLGHPTTSEREAVIAHLDPHFPSSGGSGVDANADRNTELLRLLVYLRAPGIIEDALTLIENRPPPKAPSWAKLAARSEEYGTPIAAMIDNPPPSREIGYAFLLRNLRKKDAGGWSPGQRRRYFTFLNQAANHPGGNSYAGFLTQIRNEALGNCSNAEREAIADLTGENFNPVPDFEIHPVRGPGHTWNVAEATAASANLRGADFERGRSLFHAAACATCHRFDGLGGDIGPDLTSVAYKFDPAYLAEAIVDPSRVIADEYGSHTVTMSDGTVHVGLVNEGENEIEIYPANINAKPIVVARAAVTSIEETPVSQMPPGLVNAMSKNELRDLLAYLVSGGNRQARVYTGKRKR
ncbi:MAG: c-type cytochrome, partial [Verrucomicrobiales bacterium]